MLKIFLTSITILLISVTVCGQHLTPKRIVFSGDTGIFFNHKQEIELLVKFKQLEGCRLEKSKWEKYATDADLQIARERAAYDALNKEYSSLAIVAKDFQEKYKDEYASHEQTKLALSDEAKKRLTWKRWTIGLGAGNLILGSVVYFLIK